MILGGQRPHGFRLGQPTNVKVKGLQIQRQNDEPTTTSMYVNWRWDTNFKPQINLAVYALGANCVKFANSAKAVTSGALSQAVHDARMRQFLDYTVQIGVNVYWCLHYFQESLGIDTDQATETAVRNAARILGQYPNIIGVDVSNEAVIESGGTFNAACISNQRAGYDIVKAEAPNVPASGSLVVANSSQWTQNLTDYAAITDFWDFHPYYNPSGDPAVADLLGFRTGTLHRPWLIGECGLSVLGGSVAQTSRWNALGQLAALPDSYGCVGYTTTDCEGSNDFGIYSNDFLTERTYLATAFAAWPGHV